MHFYNDNNPENVAWLRSLIDEGHIPAGVVDGRSILEIQPNDLTGFTQCHFFAGVGGWPLALSLAGVSANTPLWTASCPCQPFSQTGKRLGFADERHLWPVFRGLVEVARPPVLIGEQVASKDAELWLDGVFDDLEALGFAVGATDLPAASVGAPNLRQRFWWVANANDAVGAEGSAIDGRSDSRSDASARAGLGCGGGAGRLADADHEGQQGRGIGGDGGGECAIGAPSLGRWSAFEFVECADGKVRRVEPGSFPLAHGVPVRLGPLLTALRPMGAGAIKNARLNRVLRLHAYGNAINPFVGAEFVTACREAGILT